MSAAPAEIQAEIEAVKKQLQELQQQFMQKRRELQQKLIELRRMLEKARRQQRLANKSTAKYQATIHGPYHIVTLHWQPPDEPSRLGNNTHDNLIEFIRKERRRMKFLV